MLKHAFVIASLILSSNAFATGAYTCNVVNNSDVKFALDFSVTSGMGSPILDADGAVSVALTDGAPAQSAYTFNKKSIPQYWNSNGALNLVVYSERDGAANSIDSVKIVIETKYDDADSVYRGKASLAYDWKAKGQWKNWSASDLDVVCEAVE